MSGNTSKPIEFLHVAVRRSFEKATSSNTPQGVRDNLDILLRKLGQIRALEDKASPRRIGVFGPPNRGKSTLLNELLGAAILTTSPIPMTRTVIEAHRADLSSLNSEWQVEVIHDDDFINTFNHNTPEEVAATIQQFGSHRSSGAEVRRIIVRSPFNKSKLMERNGILIDTPGAEVAFEDLEQDHGEDTRRAVGMLKEVHVVLFCVRADQIGSESERAFYQDHMRLLDPINIVNFKDTNSDDVSLIRDTVKHYGFKRDRIYLVSSRDAQKAKSIEEKDASGLPMLEDAIVQELARFTPRDGLLCCTEEFVTVLENQACAGIDVLPEQIHLKKVLNAAYHSAGLISEATERRLENVLERLRKFVR